MGRRKKSRPRQLRPQQSQPRQKSKSWLTPLVLLAVIVMGLVLFLLGLTHEVPDQFVLADDLASPFPAPVAYDQSRLVAAAESPPTDSVSLAIIDVRKALKKSTWTFSDPLRRYTQTRGKSMAAEIALGKNLTGKLDMKLLKELVPGIQWARLYAKQVPTGGVTDVFLKTLNVINSNSALHFGATTIECPLPDGTTAPFLVLMVADILPPVSPQLIENNLTCWTQCLHCRKRFQVYGGTHSQSSTYTLSLLCPGCSRRTEVFGPDTQGHYHYPTWYLRGFMPYEVDSPVDAWLTVLTRCRYRLDKALYGRDEAWQSARLTWTTNAGDCEDSSILLADWLESMGYPCSVVMGTYDNTGHAWVVLKSEKNTYILETTGGRGSYRRVPPRAEFETAYEPEFQFNRRGLFLLRTPVSTGDYEGADVWKHQPNCPRAEIRQNHGKEN